MLVVAVATNVEVERLPIGVAELVQGRGGLGRGTQSRFQHDTPVRGSKILGPGGVQTGVGQSHTFSGHAACRAWLIVRSGQTVHRPAARG